MILRVLQDSSILRPHIAAMTLAVWRCASLHRRMGRTARQSPHDVGVARHRRWV